MDTYVIPWTELRTQALAAVSRPSQASYFRLPHPAREDFSGALESTLTKTSAAPQSVSSSTHQVQAGDTLSQIVAQHLRNNGVKAGAAQVAVGVRRVTKDNHLANPDLIHPGQRLDLSGLTTGSSKSNSLPSALAKPVSIEAPPVLPKTSVTNSSTLSAPKALETEAPRTVPPKPYIQQGGPMKLPRFPTPHPIRFEDTDPLSREEIIQAAHRPTVDLTLLVDQIMSGEKAKSSAETLSPWRKTLDGKARLSSTYGMRKDPFTGRPAFHAGIDLAAKSGTPIHPFQKGVVSFSGWKGGYGRVVVVKHDNGLESVYGHNSKNLVKVGQRVEEDTQLGLVGSSGRSTGPHMHFEIRRNGRAVNPIPYLKDDTVKLAKAL